MQKENKTLGLVSKGILILGIIAVLLVFLYALVPSIVGAMVPGGMPAPSSSGGHYAISNGLTQLVELVGSIISSLLFLVLIPFGLLSFAGMVLSILEIANAGNSGGWKALWIIITILFGGFGVLAYWHFGRKSLQ